MVAVVLEDFPPRHFVAPRIRHRVGAGIGVGPNREHELIINTLCGPSLLSFLASFACCLIYEGRNFYCTDLLSPIN